MKVLEITFIKISKEIPVVIKENDVAKWHFYAAVNCGGGEIALYTIYAGLFRKSLESIDNNLRLAINQEISKSIKPDFQVFNKTDPQKPLFAAEFKLLYETGESNSRPENVLIRIQDDVDRLRKISNDETSVAMVVFHVSNSEAPKPELLSALSAKGFTLQSTIPLWQPEDVTEAGYLHIHTSDHESIRKYGKPLEEKKKAG